MWDLWRAQAVSLKTHHGEITMKGRKTTDDDGRGMRDEYRRNGVIFLEGYLYPFDSLTAAG